MEINLHTMSLAQLSPAIASIACLSTAYVIVWMVFFRQRPVWFLLLVGSYMSWCIFFSLLYISAGPAPILDRGESAFAIRNAEWIGGVLLLSWAAMMAKQFVQSTWLPTSVEDVL